MALLICIIYFAFFPIKIVEFNEIQGYDFLVEAETLTQGDEIPLFLDTCLYYKGPAFVNYRLIGDTISSFPEFSVNVEKGCRQTRATTLTVPSSMPPGEYVLRLDVVYEVNFLRTVSKTWQSNSFVIE
jgi:hypothetical protein